MALVLKSWDVNDTQPNADGNLISIECRKQGLIAFLLTAMGIAPTTSVKVGPERIEFTNSSLDGYARRMIPIPGICSSYYGFKRPLVQSCTFVGFMTAVSISLAIQVSGILGLAVFSVSVFGTLLYYLLNKKLSLGFVEVSGVVSGIEIKRSVIEGRTIEEADARRVCEIVQRIVEKYRHGT